MLKSCKKTHNDYNETQLLQEEVKKLKMTIKMHKNIPTNTNNCETTTKTHGKLEQDTKLQQKQLKKNSKTTTKL